MKRLVVLVAALTACGGGSQVTANPSNSSTTGSVAARAVEPRTNDPTAAPPAPPRPTGGVTTDLESAPGPSNATNASAKAPVGEGSPTKASKSDPPKRIGARHVLVQWMGADRAPSSVVRSRDQALVVAQEVLRRAKSGEDFARLAIEYSDEPGAGGRGGSLGRFGHGQMVPAFEAAVFKLEVGQISEIVETPFGFHVILRTE